jgi:predicted O-methyltransferase YrrM
MNEAQTEQQALSKKFGRDSNMVWLDDLTIQCQGVKLQLTQGFDLKDSSAEVVSIFKHPSFVRDYVQCLEGVDARNVVEVGVKHGGSAIFFWNLLTPDKLCCIELSSAADQLTAYIKQQGLTDRLTAHYGIDQGDKLRLREILDGSFGEAPLDVVIDDASHLYTPSLATFEVLFPRLRPGGLYFLEDWAVHVKMARHGREPHGEEPPLHRLVHELLNVSMTHSGIISKVSCHRNFVVFERGKYTRDAGGLDVRAILDADSRVIEY